jgi:hypothetical protein
VIWIGDPTTIGMHLVSDILRHSKVAILQHQQVLQRLHGAPVELELTQPAKWDKSDALFQPAGSPIDDISLLSAVSDRDFSDGNIRHNI